MRFCMLDNEGYKNTLNIFTYCFLVTTLFAKMRLNITFICTLSCLFVISGFRREIDENCALLGCYTANNGTDSLSRNIGKKLPLLAA
jgi:hypothetical protein